jgi:hypothetical protein
LAPAAYVRLMLSRLGFKRSEVQRIMAEAMHA